MAKETYVLQISENAPLIPSGASIGKESMIFSYSNSILEIAPFLKISDAARMLYLFLTSIILEETHEALNNGSFSFDERTRRFYTNIGDFLRMSDKVGKKHYTFADIDAASDELVDKPLKFIKENGESLTKVALFSLINIDTVTGDCYFDVHTELLVHYVPELSYRKEAHLISLLETFKFSNTYADALYRLINGYIQMVDVVKDYPVSILSLKKKMGLTPDDAFWNNKLFINRVLNKAVSSINEISDISFSYKTRKYEKQNRIKDIIFIDIKRKGVKVNAQPHEAIMDDIVLEDTDHENTPFIPIDETSAESNFSTIGKEELQLARCFTFCKEEGFNTYQAMQLYEVYKDNINDLYVMNELFNVNLKYKKITEEDKFLYFMNQGK